MKSVKQVILLILVFFVFSAGKASAALDLAFAYSVSDDTASAVAVGLNAGLNYENTQGSGWSNLTGAGMNIISDYGDQLTRCYLYALSGNNSVQCKLGGMTDTAVMEKWNAYLQSPLVQNNLGNIRGFALSDDWYSNGGAGKELFQRMTASVHAYAPGQRSICIFTANTSYASSAQSYSNFAAALNYSPSGCDMVGFYLYPTVNNKPLTNFTNAIAGLKLNGLTASTPIIGIAESYNTTGAAVETEVKYMCDNGASSIGFWAYNTGLGTAAAESADIRGGMSRGLQYCGGATPGGATPAPTPTPVPSTPAQDDSDAEFSGGTGAGAYQATETQDAAGGATEVTGLYQPPTDLPSTAVTACRVDETANNSAGLIPCGRSANDPATPWNECSPCTLFSMILMGQLAIEFLVKMAAIAAVLSIIAGGFLYVFAAGKEKLITQAKSMITAVITGFTVILIAWVIIDAILSSLGYINPLGGEWYALENPEATAVTTND